MEVPSVEAAKGWCDLWGRHYTAVVGQMSYVATDPLSWEEWTVERGGFHDTTRSIVDKVVPSAVVQYVPATLARSARRIAEQITGTYAYRLTGLEPLAVKGHRRTHRSRTRVYLRQLVNDLRFARKIRDDFQTVESKS